MQPKTNYLILFILLLGCCCKVTAQTDMDAIMMDKKQLCIGPMLNYSSWKNYWEGSFKRDNENLGRVSTTAYAVMGAYGVNGKLNLLFGVPYIKTKASQGTLHSMQGLQDLSLFIKWMPIEKDLGPGTFSLYGIGGLSIPLTNYVADYLPLSIGLHSKTASARLMVDYQVGAAFATAAYTYVLRDNVAIDRDAYYTTESHLTNIIDMPNASNFNCRAGYRSSKMILEAVLNKFTTLGGFDITKNNMPFPSNKMNATTLGINVKYVVANDHSLSIIGGANKTIAGRNMGEASAFYGGIFYIIDFSKKSASSSHSQPAKKS